MRRRVLALLAVAGAVALSVALLVETARRPPLLAPRPPDDGPGGGPEIVLEEVRAREIRGDGEALTVRADRATYHVLSRILDGQGVRVGTEGDGTPQRRVTAYAPRGLWEMDAGIVRFPAGGTVGSGGGWEARVPEAALDLARGILTAPAADLAGPGLSVRGAELAWDFREGTVRLENPRSVVSPRVLRGTGAGGRS